VHLTCDNPLALGVVAGAVILFGFFSYEIIRRVIFNERRPRK
jgi:hypothetical protein